MPDWNALLRERFSELELPAHAREEIIAELASHLQETYDERLRQACSESEAFRFVTDSLGDSRKLAAAIRRAKAEGSEMSRMTKQLWLPGLVSTVVMSGMWAALIVADASIRVFDNLIYVELLLVGALGAYLSRRAQGSGWMILVSGLFPAATMLVAVVLVVIFAALLGFPVPATEYDTLAKAMAIFTLSPLPVVLPFLRGSKNSVSHA